MKTARILHAYKIYKPESEGGIPEIISTLTTRNGSEFENSVVVPRKGASLSYVIDSVPVTSTRSVGSLFSMPIAPSYPSTFIREARRVDLVVHHAPFPLSDIAITAHFPSFVGLVVFWHADVVGRVLLKRATSPFTEFSLRRADRVIVSHASIASHSKVLAPYRDKISVVPYGTDVSYWGTPNAETVTHAQKISNRFPRLVVFVGRLVGYKGLGVLLEAVKRTDADLVIVGKGPLQAELNAQALHLGILDRVKFVGEIPRAEIKSFLYAAHALVLPSISKAEAFGLVQMEAMAAGCPVINTSLPTAVPDVARHGHEGLTVPPNNARALADAIQSIIDSPALRTKLGAAGKERAFNEYDANVFRKRMASVYCQVIETRRGLQNTGSASANGFRS